MAVDSEFLREARRRGGQARQQLPGATEHQRNAGLASAKVNDMAALGRKGFDSCVAKYGWLFAFQRARNWRLDHPSWPEQQVMAILGTAGVFYQREAQVLGEDVPVAVDIHIADTMKIIEVEGKVHTSPFFDDDGDRQQREQLRLQRLERAGFQVLVVDYRELVHVDSSRRKILDFVEGAA